MKLKCEACGNTDPAKFSIQEERVVWRHLLVESGKLAAGKTLEEYVSDVSVHCSECSATRPLSDFHEGVKVVSS